jgi:hypothetical protein
VALAWSTAKLVEDMVKGGTITSSGGYKYHTFLSNNTFIVS